MDGRWADGLARLPSEYRFLFFHFDGELFVFSLFRPDLWHFLLNLLFNSRNCTYVTLYGISYDTDLERFISSAPRYRLAVRKTDSSFHEEKSLNLGRELALAVEKLDRHNEVYFQFSVQDAISRIIKSHIFTDPVLGDVVILDNPGILFEPDLRIDVSDVLRRVSRNTLTILLWPGVIRPDKLFFLREGSHIAINQSEINYIIL